MKIVQIYKNQIIKFFKTETILVIAITLAILSSFIAKFNDYCGSL